LIIPFGGRKLELLLRKLPITGKIMFFMMKFFFFEVKQQLYFYYFVLLLKYESWGITGRLLNIGTPVPNIPNRSPSWERS
jgi:hypothetical protein